jgi:HSP20 family protein
MDSDFFSFQRGINRLFDEFFRDFGLAPARRFETGRLEGLSPRVDVSETDDAVAVSADLPGLDRDDVSVEVDEECLRIRGERKDDREDRGRHWYRREQTFGSFERVIPLPCRIKPDGATATFKKGVLNVTLKKHEEARAQRRVIDIESA